MIGESGYLSDYYFIFLFFLFGIIIIGFWEGGDIFRPTLLCDWGGGGAPPSSYATMYGNNYHMAPYTYRGRTITSASTDRPWWPWHLYCGVTSGKLPAAVQHALWTCRLGRSYPVAVEQNSRWENSESFLHNQGYMYIEVTSLMFTGIAVLYASFSGDCSQIHPTWISQL